MSDHLSARVHEALAEAGAVAHRLAHHYIGTEHLLVGLARVAGGPARDGLARCGLTAERLEQQVEDLLGRGVAPLAVQPPLTSSAALALERSRWEARQLGRTTADTDHVLLALLRLPTSTAVSVVNGAGIETEQVELALADTSAGFTPVDAGGDRGDGVVLVNGRHAADGDPPSSDRGDRELEPLAIVVARLSREVSELRAEVAALRSRVEPPPEKA